MRQLSAFVPQYERLLRRDPKSKVFAALAEAYREYGDFLRAEKVARHGLKHNSDYASGFLVLGRILFDTERYSESLAPLLEATRLSPQNLLAHQLLAEVYLQLGDHKQALRMFKLVLFMNPTSEKAKKAVSQLEALTATEFGEDLFSLKPLTGQESKPLGLKDSEEYLERSLSLLDAFIMRNEVVAAKTLLANLTAEFGEEHPQLEKRRELVGESQTPLTLVPLRPRKDLVREEQIKVLKSLLKNIEKYRLQRVDGVHA